MTPAAAIGTACVLALSSPVAAKDDARIAPEAYPHFRVLELALNRTGPQSSLFYREGPCRYRHTFGRDIVAGTWIDRETPIDFSLLDADALRVEDRDGGQVKMVIVPQLAEAGQVTHRLAMTDQGGTYHPSFLERYGGVCEGMYCDAELTNSEIFVAIVGAPSAGDVDAVVSAMRGLAAYCAAATKEG